MMNSKQEIKEFVIHTFQQILHERFESNNANIGLKIINIKTQTNGFIRIYRNRKRYKFKMYININRAVNDSSISEHMKLFYLNATILHEFEHIDIILNKECDSYERLLAVVEMEEELNKSIFDIIWNKLKNLVTFGEAYKRYATSSIEIWCGLCGLKNAYKEFCSFMSTKESEQVKEMCESLELIIANQIIGYYQNGIPFNKFINMLELLLQMSKKNNKICKELNAEDIVSDGKIKHIRDIFNNKDKNKVSDALLINYFLNVELNYFEIFHKDTKLKEYMEIIINDFYDKCIEYIRNKEKCKLFIIDEIIEDNLKVILNYIKKIELYLEKSIIHRDGERVLEIM